MKLSLSLRALRVFAVKFIFLLPLMCTQRTARRAIPAFTYTLLCELSLSAFEFIGYLSPV